MDVSLRCSKVGQDDPFEFIALYHINKCVYRDHIIDMVDSKLKILREFDAIKKETVCHVY